MTQVMVSAWDVVRAEFSDIPDVGQIVIVLIRLSLAAVLGALLGYQRETVGSAAGLRTHILVSLGSAIFVLVPLQAGMALGDLSRVLQASSPASVSWGLALFSNGPTTMRSWG